MANTYIQKVIEDVDVSDVVNKHPTNMTEDEPLSVADIKKNINLLHNIMKEVMVEDKHYGKIPGCGDKPCLLKPGAEKLSLTFRLHPIINNVGDVLITQLPAGHINIEVFCHIMTSNGVEVATGIGSCSTMESKYRYRAGEKKGTGKPVPKEYWNLKKEGKIKEAQALIGGHGFSPGKINGEWQICEIGEKMENPDIADTYNTVLKMAKKRAYVDGILSATCASDIFTQDVEDSIDEDLKVSETQEPIKEEKSDAMLTEPKQTVTENIGHVIAINKETKTNRKTNQQFIVYKIKLNNNAEYTASGKNAESIMNLANTARKDGLKVSIKTKGDEYNTITEIDTVEPDLGDIKETELKF